jgi:hypothetical protein
MNIRELSDAAIAAEIARLKAEPVLTKAEKDLLRRLSIARAKRAAGDGDESDTAPEVAGPAPRFFETLLEQAEETSLLCSVPGCNRRWDVHCGGAPRCSQHQWGAPPPPAADYSDSPHIAAKIAALARDPNHQDEGPAVPCPPHLKQRIAEGLERMKATMSPINPLQENLLNLRARIERGERMSVAQRDWLKFHKDHPALRGLKLP